MDKDLDMKLVKGPEKSLSNELVFSEMTSKEMEDVFNFTIKAYVSNSSTTPVINRVSQPQFNQRAQVNQIQPGIQPPPYNS